MQDILHLSNYHARYYLCNYHAKVDCNASKLSKRIAQSVLTLRCETQGPPAPKPGIYLSCSRHEIQQILPTYEHNNIIFLQYCCSLQKQIAMHPKLSKRIARSILRCESQGAPKQESTSPALDMRYRLQCIQTKQTPLSLALALDMIRCYFHYCIPSRLLQPAKEEDTAMQPTKQKKVRSEIRTRDHLHPKQVSYLQTKRTASK